MNNRRIFSVALLFLATFCASGVSLAQDTPQAAEEEKKENALFTANFQNAPTYIKSSSMTLFSEQRKVEYRDKVEVLHEDMRMICDRLEALYTADNEIDKIFAYDNVFITRENGTQARSERAVYEKATETITLTVNPEVQENGSVVTADTIRIYLQEDRSEAEGSVRVKLIQQEPKDAAKGAKKKDGKNPSLSKIF